MATHPLLYNIALTLIPGVGDVLAKNLISYCGSAQAIFRSPKQKLVKIPGVGAKIAQAISGQNVLERAEAEIEFIEKNNIEPIFYLDDAYPVRLKHCHDSPILLYYKGNADLNRSHVISIVGTRKASAYGKIVCEQIVEALSAYQVLIVSGLAYGIDICAHKAALRQQMDTIGVLGHGLDRIYPYRHNEDARKMIMQGGLLTEFPSQTKPDRENFPRRNRIVAGMSDATLVIETAKKGGAMITAHIAHSYNRDVFAIPGRIKDGLSAGSNQLIKSNIAALVESVEDIVYAMGWEQPATADIPAGEGQQLQKSLLLNMSQEEKNILEILKDHADAGIDEIIFRSQMSTSTVASVLLNLECSGIIKALPGKRYQLT